MSKMADYDSSVERPKGRQSSVEMGAEHGVSEADEKANEGWGHRSSIARNAAEKDKQASISGEVNDRRNGTAHHEAEPEPTRHEQQQQERPKADNHGEQSVEDFEFHRPLNIREKSAMMYGQYWPESKKRDFVENDTPLRARDFGWDL